MLRFLGEPENVAKFQRFCGLTWENTIKEVEGEEKVENHKYDNLHSPDSHNHNNGFSNINGYKNGFNSYQKAERAEPTEKEYTYNIFIHKLFEFGSELGNELFYITFLPFVFWNIDDYIARRLVILWVFNMYAGQGLKDILCWPRPKCPPVLRLEQIYESEYGMPSTHAIAGSIIPFALVYFSYGRFQYDLVYGIIFFICWTTLVCLSRIYRGMHTFQDILAGLSVAAFVTALWLPYLDLTLEIFLSSPNAWIFILLIPILMIYVFPAECMETRNDTARIISAGCGAMFAAWNEYYIDQVPIPNPYQGSPRPMISTGLVEWTLFGASRFIIGVAILIPIKIVLKAVIYHTASFMNSSNVKSTERTANESFTIPYLFTTYSAIGYTTVYVAPKAFEMVGLIL